MSDTTRPGTLHPTMFDPGYQLRMIQAYPTIAGLTEEEIMGATPEEKLEAFTRILEARHLRRTHHLYLDYTESRDE